MVGGPTPDAGSRVQITRKSEWGPIPLPNAKIDSNGYSVAEVNLRDITNSSHPEENIQIRPNDVISVPRAEIVYVIGEVGKPGGFALNDKENISVLQALALANGLTPNAARNDGKIIRPVPGANRVELAINLKELLNGKAKDMILQPEDILFVPTSYTKGAMKRTLESVVQMTTGMVIYRGW
jgi:polysaccharide export outer membrane protein